MNMNFEPLSSYHLAVGWFATATLLVSSSQLVVGAVRARMVRVARDS